MPKQTTYSCIVFLGNGEVKKWKYVRDLKSFSNFLSKTHSSWKYFNVYEKASNSYLKRFYSGNVIPKTLGVAGLVLASLFASSQCQAHEKHLPCFVPCHNRISVQSKPLKNTFNKTTFVLSPSTNGFNNTATIPTTQDQKGVGVC